MNEITKIKKELLTLKSSLQYLRLCKIERNRIIIKIDDLYKELDHIIFKKLLKMNHKQLDDIDFLISVERDQLTNKNNM